MDEKRKLEEMKKQVQLEKQATQEAKMSEKEYLKELKEKDYQAYLNNKRQTTEHALVEEKEFVKSLAEREAKEINERKQREALKKSMVKDELSQQIVQKKRMSDRARRSQLEEKIELPLDKNELAEQKIKQIRNMEKQIIKNQCEVEKKLKQEKVNTLKAREREERLRTEADFKNLTQKQVQEKLQKVQEMNQFLMKQMENKNFRDRLEKQYRKEGEKLFANKYKDKGVREKMNCQMCHKDYKLL